MPGRFAATAASICSVTQGTFIKPSWAPRPGDMVVSKTDKNPCPQDQQRARAGVGGIELQEGDPGQGGLDGTGAAVLGASSTALNPEPVQGGQGCHFGMSEF